MGTFVLGHRPAWGDQPIVSIMQLLSDHIPIVDFLGSLPSSAANPLAKADIFEKFDNGRSKRIRIVPNENVFPIHRLEAFAAN